MTPTHNDRPELGREDQEFVKRVAANFGPAPMGPARRVAFDEALRAALRARLRGWLERPRRRRILVPAFATAAVVAAVALLLFSDGFELVPPEGGVQPSSVVADAGEVAQWEYELVYLGELAGLEDRDDSELFPDDYLAIASVFLSG